MTSLVAGERHRADRDDGVVRKESQDGVLDARLELARNDGADRFPDPLCQVTAAEVPLAVALGIEHGLACLAEL